MSPDKHVQPKTGDLVVIGSSAGGVEALSVLVGTLPQDFPAPVVLAQHLDPGRPSMLADILQRRAALPVEIVTQRMPLVPGTIYVVPSNAHVAIQDGTVEVTGDAQGRPKPSVDLLLSTAAAAHGDRLIAVILTGSGSDGAVGAVDVKAAGGTVIVQNPQTARYPSMPLSLPPTVVDFEVELEQLGPLLYDLTRGVELPQPDNAQDLLRRILEQVSRQANIDFRPYKSATLLRRIGRRMIVTHISTLREYAEYVETHPQEVGELVQALLINVTQFFRDAEAFAFLKHEVLPRLVAQARSRDHVLRLWSAGCSSGEEPYSLAMLVADLLGAELPQWHIRIFATDLDDAAINYARLGIYPESLLKDVPPDYRDRYFECVDQSYRISKMLRQMVIFGQQDLSRSAPFPRVDLALCRNVLIYFTPELQDYVLNQFAFSLRPNNGYLFLGKAELIRPTHSYFEPVNKQWKIYRCAAESVPMARRQGFSDLRARLDAPVVQRRGAAAPPVPSDHETLTFGIDLPLLRRLNEQLLRFLPIGVVVIDRAYQLITVNAAARRLLSLRDVNNEQDFLHAVRGIPYPQVRLAIDAVFRDRNAVTLSEVLLDAALGGNGRYLCLTIVPMQADANTPDLAAISVSDVTEQVQTRQRLEVVQAEQSQLVSELGEANQRLNEMNKELLDANEELQVTNEEMMLTYEELQATNEEFEATNEEFEATNEEFEATNEELQATNEELQTTNDELRARSGELQELATMLESERCRLAEMVELAPFYILVLRGPHLRVEAFNSGYARLLGGYDVRGRPLEEVAQYFWNTDTRIVDLAREVYLHDSPRTSPRLLSMFVSRRGEPSEHIFVYRIVPNHDHAGQVVGVVLYAIDVTEQRAQEVLEERERLRLIFEHAEQMALGLYDAATTELIMGTPQYLDVLARAHTDARPSFIGASWSETAFIGPGEQALQLWEQVQATRTPARVPEVRLMLVGDGHETVWNWNLIPVVDPEQPDVIRFMMVLALEITEQVHAREEAQRLDHLKDEFLSLASHELRTPLTSLIGNAYILERMIKAMAGGQPPNQPALERYVESIKKQLERLNVLIEDLIDVGRLQSGKYSLNLEQIELMQVVQQAVEEARAISAMPPIVVHSPQVGELPVCGDRVRLMQVLLNLLQNALSYAPQSPQIDVWVRCLDYGPGAASAQIEVQDYGPGIAPEDQQAIFSRFYQTQQPQRTSHRGLGLGLFICREIVEQHGGAITVDAQIGQGSMFIVRLPLLDGELRS
jgi:two-component system CheB/CheR fusion protein